ncbi:hypothetical protein DFH07DRAFT_866418 [Mycena maculata]|uniref:C2H2-type domain-containing protein n=1 Tax=Mycena maculata TaxID=230809 RepID=A0AAD7JT97_9AGAR|nr:hypothetical protein DFH07DRAFT_866418 [Mycena maculata]
MPHGVSYTCPTCLDTFTSKSGLACHQNSEHRQFTPAEEGEDKNSFQRRYHLLANALPCNENGDFLPPHAALPPLPPPPQDGQDPAAWDPFDSRWTFDFAQFQFVELQASERNINTALNIWAASLCKSDQLAQFKNAKDLYATIEPIQHGDAPWKTYTISYTGPLPPGTSPRWMAQAYELCTRDVRQLLHHQLGTSDFKDSIDYVPYHQFNHSGHQIWSNLMLADWVWKQADIITQDPTTHGCTFVPIVAGSNKTTVSVATGHQEYHPRPKHHTKPAYQNFCRQMYHASLARIFQPLKANMVMPNIVRCADGHFLWLAGIVQNWCPKCEAHPDHLDAEGSRLRTKTKTDALIMCFDPGIIWDDYGIRSDIVVSAMILLFPSCMAFRVLTSTSYSQVIKGTFKDHIVSWVNEYLVIEHGEKRALEIIQDIDRRLSAVPEFPGLRRFPDGRDFHQWTGDNSKSAHEVASYLPSDMLKMLAAFMDFCYIVRRNAISSIDLTTIQNALDRFHHYQTIFIECGVRTDISLPRQHSLVHYPHSIRLFGSLNGLCSSITESEHINAVKEPWRHSSRYHALAQMLVTLTWLDKLAAVRHEFTACGMMTGTTSSYTAMVLAGYQPQVAAAQAAAAAAVANDDDEDDDGVVHGPRSLSDIELAPTPRASPFCSSCALLTARLERGYPKYLQPLAAHVSQPTLPLLLRYFLHAEVHGPLADNAVPPPLQLCPNFDSPITVQHSAIARFYALRDICGAGGMYREHIRSNPRWHGYARQDTVLVNVGGPVMGGIIIGRVMLFFSFVFGEKEYQCVLVHWLVPVGEGPDPDTGMWVVEPEDIGGLPSMEVITVNTIARACHLIGVYGTAALPEDFHFSCSLDAFNSYFVNHYAYHHMYEFLA